jgi:type 1 glutamine amidotransferase
VIRNLGIQNGFDVDTTNATNSFFIDSSLAKYAAICFVNTTGALFTSSERDAFKRFMQAGGGYVGIHASTDCEYEWPWYGQMSGANFNGHPFNVATAKIAILDKKHPSTEFITSDTLSRTDEWYFWGQDSGFKNNPIINPAENDSIHVLMNLVESSLPNSTLNHFHPMCWYQNFEGGRVWYLGFGHDPKTFNEPLMKQMILGGILYAAGMTKTSTVQKNEIFRLVMPVTMTNAPIVYDLLGRTLHSKAPSARRPTSAGFHTHNDNVCNMRAGFFIFAQKTETRKIVKKIAFIRD